VRSSMLETTEAAAFLWVSAKEVREKSTWRDGANLVFLEMNQALTIDELILGSVITTDCDHDDECAGDLRCFQRDGTTEVPGCGSSSSYSNSDFCYEGPSFIRYRGNNGNGPFPLGECEGYVTTKPSLNCLPATKCGILSYSPFAATLWTTEIVIPMPNVKAT
jgi:hypothetical protein